MIIGSTFRLVVRWKVNVISFRNAHTNLKILYFGTDKFSLNSLHKLSQENFSRLSVVTSFKAKNNVIKSYTHKNDIECIDWKDLKENREKCKEFDLGVVVSFGHLIPEDVINSFKLGMLNVHGSLLPKYRGASPIIYAIKNGDKVTGVSIMRIRPKKFDIGEVYASEKISISDEILMPELHDRMAEIGGHLLLDCIKNLENLQPKEQDETKSSYAPKVDNEFCKVRWDEMTSEDVFNLYRSIFGLKNPHTTFNGELTKLIEIAKFTESIDDIDLTPGACFYNKIHKKLLVACSDGKLVEVRKLNIVSSKKVMSGIDFRNGFLKNYEKNLGYFM